jgi:cupin 2 domain-containing protein
MKFDTFKRQGGGKCVPRFEYLGPRMTNLFHDLPPSLAKELVEVLAENQHVRIERIVSTGHASPPGYWYDQEETEWVVVLSGEVKLRFENDNQPITMRPGDHLLIPPHRKHRVEWTSPDEPTVWLAVFYR